MVERLRELAVAAGRDPETIGIEAKLKTNTGSLDHLAADAQAWRAIGATHIDIDTMGAGFVSLPEHLNALEQVKQII